MPEWKDTTSYSRDKERIPNCWSIESGWWRLTVLNGHIRYPGEWIMHFDPFLKTKQLHAEDEASAKRKAIAIAGKLLAQVAEEFHQKTKP